jgi:hypothetical protein
MSLATSISSLYVSRAPVTPGDHLLQWETFVSPPSWATTGHLTTTGRALRVDVLTTGGTPTFVAQFWQGPWSAMLSAGLLFVSLELWRRARSSRAVMV